MKIAVIGHVLIDYVYQVEEIPSLDDEYRIIKEAKYPGGSALNTAVGLKNLGSEPVVIANIGKDDRGLYLVGFLRDKGIPLKGIKVVEGETGYCVVIRDTKGNILLLSKLNVAEPLTIDEQRAELIRSVEHVHITSLSMASLRDILRTIEQVGLNATMSWDIGRVTAKEGLDSFKNYLGFFNILFASQRELEHVFKDKRPADFFNEIMDDFKGVFIVKKGRGGVTVYAGEGRVLEAYVTQPVLVKDSLGAGDAFASCYLHYHLMGFDEGEAVRKCVIFSTLKVGFEGGSSMPSFNEFEKESKILSEKVVVKNIME